MNFNFFRDSNGWMIEQWPLWMREKLESLEMYFSKRIITHVMLIILIYNFMMYNFMIIIFHSFCSGGKVSRRQRNSRVLSTSTSPPSNTVTITLKPDPRHVELRRLESVVSIILWIICLMCLFDMLWIIVCTCLMWILLLFFRNWLLLRLRRSIKYEWWSVYQEVWEMGENWNYDLAK